jgi:Peptidase M10 serralysin C terminal/Domain of unknown function (DUF4114)
MTNPLEAEIADLSAVDAHGLVAAVSYGTWRDAPGYPTIPATYGSTSDAFKWGGATPGTTATITYWYDTASGWTDAEKQAFDGAFGLWTAVANVTIGLATSAATADFDIIRTSHGGADWNNASFTHPAVGSSTLGLLPASTDNRIQIDTNYTGPITDLAANYGYAVNTMVHELGHMLGLGHGGPYDGGVNAMTQQFGPYDTRLWTLMSYIGPEEPAAYSNDYPVAGTEWNNYLPLTPMPLDILAVQRLYGVATSGPLTGGDHTFGFNSNIQGPIGKYFNFDVNQHPIVTIWENGHNNTLDLSKYSTDSVIDLHPGAFSSAGGMKNNIGIAFGTIIETAIGGSGNDKIYASDVDSKLMGGAGSDVLVGGAGNDVLTGGPGPDTIDGGGGLNIARDTLANMNGDTIFHFGQSTTIDVTGSLIGRDHLKIMADADGNTTLGMGDSELLLIGSFSGGDFMAVARNNGPVMHTDVSYEPYLPRLVEGVAVAPGAVNGVANQPFLTGDNTVHFSVSLLAAIAAFNDSLGYYEVGTDGKIKGVDMLFANTHNPGTTTVTLATPGSGEQIGFFLIANGFNQFGDLGHNLAFVAQGGGAPSANGGPVFLQSATLGILNGATVFHSFANLNPDGAHVLSGVAPGGHDLQMGFEDLPRATGDNDFQDVVINIHTDRDGVLVL